MAVTKSLVSATPEINASTGYVKAWDISVLYTTESEDFSNSYSRTIEVDETRKPTEYTKSELIQSMPEIIEEEIFPAHYDAFLNPPVKQEEKAVGFDINSLSE